MPALSSARARAKKVVCSSNFRQIGIVIATYAADHDFDYKKSKPPYDRTWVFMNGSGDFAHEKNRMKESVMADGLLEDHRMFFCPSVKNLAHDKNYDSKQMTGSATPISYDTQTLTDQGKTPAFWSSYLWIYKKEITQGNSHRPFQTITSVNGGSSGAMMLDMTRFGWQLITTSPIGKTAKAIGIEQSKPHYNVLMDDLSVQSPYDRDIEITYWLWNSDLWAGKYIVK